MNILDLMSPFFTSKQNAVRRKKNEIFKAYKWIRENNNTIPDDVLDLMYHSAIEKVESNPEILKK